MNRDSISRRCYAGMCLVLAVCLETTSIAQTDVELPERDVMASAVATAEPFVVQIETIGGTDLVAGMRVTRQPTTGIIVSRDGHVVTAALNLAHKPTTVFVRLPDGSRLPAESVATNHARRVVLLRVSSARKFDVPEFASRSQLAVGQSVIALGRSMDINRVNVSSGILGAKNRIWGKAIQTDAAISPHNFGGPLINLRGDILGVLVPLSPRNAGPVDGTDWYDSGVGFAIPLEELRIPEMINGHDLEAGLLGASFKEDKGYASPAIISTCPGNSPAAVAGLKSGDEITQINGQEIRRVSGLRHALGPLYAGDRLEILARRGEQTITTTAKLVEALEPFRYPMIGVVPDPNPQNAGIRVSQVISDSPAAGAGLEPGDLILRIDDQPVNHVDSVTALLNQFEIGEKVNVVIDGARGRQTVAVALDELVARTVLLDAVETEGEEPENDWVDFRVPEHPNPCRIYVPATLSGPAGLLLWIGEPGDIRTDDEWNMWCERFGVAVLLPQSHDSREWSIQEVEFLNKAVEHARQQYNIDDHRIAVGGKSTGGVMASLAAFDQRNLYRGVVLLDTPPSQRISSVQSDASLRMMVLLLEDEADQRTREEMLAAVEHFRQKGFPVHSLSLESPLRTIAGWVSSLNRF